MYKLFGAGSVVLVLMACSAQPQVDGNQATMATSAVAGVNLSGPGKAETAEPPVMKAPPLAATAVDEAPPRVPTRAAPSYDVEAYCETVSESVGGSYVIEKGCRDQERSALSSIQNRDIPARVARYCDQVAEAIGGSYVIFDGCVDQELGAAAGL